MNKISQIVTRFVDCDMLMRHHWGLGIGHKYSWEESQAEDSGDSQPQSVPGSAPSDTRMAMSQEELLSDHLESVNVQLQGDIDDNPELHEGDDVPGEDTLHDEMEDKENEDLGEDSDDLWTPGGEDDYLSDD